MNSSTQTFDEKVNTILDENCPGWVEAAEKRAKQTFDNCRKSNSFATVLADANFWMEQKRETLEQSIDKLHGMSGEKAQAQMQDELMNAVQYADWRAVVKLFIGCMEHE